VQSPELKDRCAAQGVQPASGTPAEFRRFTEVELEKMAQVVNKGALTALN
jgi:tripartite-type tricarboxylate transporter receptor subunit TctC